MCRPPTLWGLNRLAPGTFAQIAQSFDHVHTPRALQASERDSREPRDPLVRGANVLTTSTRACHAGRTRRGREFSRLRQNLRVTAYRENSCNALSATSRVYPTEIAGLRSARAWVGPSRCLSVCLSVCLSASRTPGALGVPGGVTTGDMRRSGRCRPVWVTSTSIRLGDLCGWCHDSHPLRGIAGQAPPQTLFCRRIAVPRDARPHPPRTG